MQDLIRPLVLREALKSRNPELYTETTALVLNATPLLWHTIATFPSGTSHTPAHTTTVEMIAGSLVGNDLLGQLTDDELQLLILACHFHDLGMAGTESDNLDETSKDNARRDHAIRVGDRIQTEWKTLGFRDATLAQLLSEVCRGHRPQKVAEKADWTEISKHRIVGPGRSVRLRVLSALIYASDELHIGADRAPEREKDWLQILRGV